MMTQEEMFLYDYMVETEIATAEELNLARNLVSGSWLEVLNSVLFVRTGYRSLEQLQDAEEEEEEEELDFTDWWDRLDDIEREEYSKLEAEYEEEGE